jgi:hypothetical protein
VATVGVIVIAAASITGYEFIKKSDTPATTITTAAGSTGTNTSNQPEIVGLQSDYPVTWEQSVGDVGAISAAGGLGDTLGGLTATGLKISWERCGQGQCPVTWILSLRNNTQDLISTAPSLGLFTSHTPIVSDSRPTTVLPGGTALLVYTFPEFKSGLKTSPRDTWQWNWYLAQLR